MGGLLVQLAHMEYARRADVRGEAADRREAERFKRETEPQLSVRHVGGFSGDGEDHVSGRVEIVNDGGAASREAVAEILLDGESIASSEPIDVGPGQRESVVIHRIPRTRIRSIYQAWSFPESVVFSLHVRDRDGFEYEWSRT